MRKLRNAAFVIAAAGCLALAATPEPHKVKIVLERYQNNSWSAVDPGLIFNQGDRVRFRATTNFSGYLYVVDYGTSGKYSVLFPSAAAGSDNHMLSGQAHPVPSSDTIFRISGPPGQDIVYWIISPIALPDTGSIPVPAKPKEPALLMPRCDDTLLRARGECIDSSAGVRDLDSETPQELEAAGKPADLTFLREDKNSVIAANGDSSGPFVYEFRLAHK